MKRILETVLMLTLVGCALWIYITWIALAYINWRNERRGDCK